MEKVFRTLGGKQILDLAAYVKDYVSLNPNTIVYIGTDSQANRRGGFMYAIVIVFHNHDSANTGKGGHVIYTTEKVYMKMKPGINDSDLEVIKMKLFGEVQRSLEVAEYVREFALDGKIDKIGSIDLDLNEDKLYKSNSILREAVGWVTGLGYKARIKPHAFAASYAADKLVR